MGVVYKLTPEISAFIIEQKKSEPKVTCQNLSGRVFLQFGEHVSKSSVHALLKQSQVITPRVRKVKDTFQIPLEKKIQISKALAPFSMNISTEPLLKKEAESTETASFLESRQEEATGEIFLKAALWDLSFKPFLGIKDFLDMDSLKDQAVKREWDYLTQAAYAVKIELKETYFYIDPRFQSLYAENLNEETLAVPIERAIGEATDCILNNREPLIIKKYEKSQSIAVLYDFFNSMGSDSGRAIKRMAILGSRNREITEFNTILVHKRDFIIAIASDHADLQWLKEDDREDFLWPNRELRVIKKEDQVIVTNMLSISVQKIVEQYFKRHPVGEQRLGLIGKESFLDKEQHPGQWLKNRLIDRAKMFFPSSNTSAADCLKEILKLSGKQKYGENSLDVFLQVPAVFEYTKELNEASKNINRLSIKDLDGRRLCILIKQQRQ